MLFIDLPLPQQTLITLIDWSQSKTPCLLATCHSHLPIQKLQEAGYLRPGKFLEYYDCEEQTTGVIRWKTSNKTGKRRAVCRCRLGHCPMDADKIRTWEILVPTLIERIGAAMGFTLPFKQAIPDIWLFGRKMRRDFYYIRGYQNEDRPAIQAFFKKLPTAVLMIPHDACYREELALLLPENRVFNVQQYCSMDYECQLTFDMKPITDDLVQTETAEKKPQTRRLEKIDRLTTVMKEHYSLAKEYYGSTDGQILRRPTQAELAKRIGTSQDVVSRCLNDEKAVVLRTLWNNAENVKAILGS
ncbi:hypothetical protein FACS18942_09330 [Planctomycetales bacterium]|nr:hypothetical protein FACS18942_09330 [Planctomycetales bacterium]